MMSGKKKKDYKKVIIKSNILCIKIALLFMKQNSYVLFVFNHEMSLYRHDIVKYYNHRYTTFQILNSLTLAKF